MSKNNCVQMETWDDALINASVVGVINQETAVVGLCLATAINWEPGNGKP